MERMILAAILVAVGLILLRLLNSCQWLIAMMTAPFMAAGLAWWFGDGIWAIIFYWLTLLAFFAPFMTGLGGAQRQERLDLRTMWQQPFSVWNYLVKSKDNHNDAP